MALTLVSHALCPYVQRAAIVLAEKQVAFTRREVDLAHKPSWFLAVSPLGKTPVLLVDEAALFESAPICEYLDETLLPRLHPDEPLARARERAWMQLASVMLDGIAALYSAPDETALAQRAQALRQQAQRLEAALHAQGPWFAGPRFGLVDACFAPALRYFEVFDALADLGVFTGLPHLAAWRVALAQRPSVQQAVGRDYAARLRQFLAQRGGALGARVNAA